MLIKMEATIQIHNLIDIMKRIEQKVDFIGEEVITMKSWLDDDSKLSPYEEKLVDETIRKIKAGEFMDMTTLEELRKKMGA